MPTDSNASGNTSLPIIKTLCFLILFFSSFTLHAQTVYAVQGNNLVSFSATTPGTINSTVPISGIVAGQAIEGLDFRPSTGQLYALGYVVATGEAQLYTITLSTGVAIPVGASITLAASMSGIGFDFNPFADRIRVTSSAGNNYRLNPATGAIVSVDTNLNFAGGDVRAGELPGVQAVAYTNSYPGATSTTVYYFDTVHYVGIINPPNAGVLNTIGNSGIAPVNNIGLDIDILSTQSPATNTAYLSATITGTANNLYTINLSTGAASLVGTIAGGLISEMAIQQSPAAAPPSYTIYAITAANSLISFNSTAPSTVLSAVAITGITAGQSIEGLDVRPADGLLYALGYRSSDGAAQLYTINTATGVATAVGSAITLATGMTGLSFDFNPVADRIRVTSSGGNNYRLNPLTGAIVSVDVNLNYPVGDIHNGATPAVYTVAYVNNYTGAATTTPFYYDLAVNSTGSLSNPNAGTMNTLSAANILPGATGLDLDIATDGTTFVNTAFLSANVSGSSNTLFTINLSTGVPTIVGTIGTGKSIIEMAVALSTPTVTPPPSHTIYAISGNNLVSFNSVTPGTISSTVVISGITAGQVIEGLDFRPANQQLYALGYNASTGQTQVYTVNTITGVFTAVGSAITLATAMSGVSFDFNPVADRIRVTSSAGHNYRLNPATGGLTSTDTPLSYAAGDVYTGTTPQVYTVAYVNNYSGAVTTSVYAYDLGVNNLAIINPPNAGTLNTVGGSGLAPVSGAGLDMDIVTDQGTGVNTAFLAANLTGSSYQLYTINLTTGFTSLAGTIGAGISISELAVAMAAPVTPPLYTVYAINSSNNLVSFNSTDPATILSTQAVTGIIAGHEIQGIDFRPATGELFALSYRSSTGEVQLYTINIANGAATTVGSPITLATGMARLSFDFNPTVDRIRVTNSAAPSQNYRLNPATATLVSTDTDLDYAAGDVHNGSEAGVYAVAYTNNYPGAVVTSLYFYDSSFNNLGIINPPNSGALNTIAGTGLLPLSGLGLDMDIATDEGTATNTGFLSATVAAGSTNFYTISLSSGLPTLVGTIGGGTTIIDMAVFSVDIVLPVRLTEFNAVKEGKKALLKWTTEAETDNDYFVIQRSEDGRSFTPLSLKIASQALSGNSTAALHYNYIDARPLKGWNYYRLVQTDKDGKKTYSDIVKLLFDEKDEIVLAPNPVHNYLRVSGVADAAVTIRISVSSAGGGEVLSEQKGVAAGAWSRQLNLSLLAKGIYFVNVYHDGKKVYSEAVIKN